MEYSKQFEEFKKSNKDFQDYYEKLEKRRRQDTFDEVYRRVETTWSVIGPQTKIEDVISNQKLIDLLQTLKTFLKENTHKWNKALRPVNSVQELLYIHELVKVYGMKYDQLI